MALDPVYAELLKSLGAVEARLEATESRLAFLEQLASAGAPAGEDDGLPDLNQEIVPGSGMTIGSLLAKFGPKFGFNVPASAPAAPAAPPTPTT